MNITDFYAAYSSDTTAGSANQCLVRYDTPVTVTGRVLYRLEHGGENYSLLFSNRIDSTFSDGSVSRANDPGGEWRIDSLRAGLCNAGGDLIWHDVTFGGSTSRRVAAGEGEFCTDPIPLDAAAGETLLCEITVTGACFPYHPEIVIPVSIFDADRGEWHGDNRLPVPLMIGSDRPVRTRVGFLGDSITQGCGTELDSYTHWAAKIAEGLQDDVSVWDLGIGYGRAMDAATDGVWLSRAKRCDTVNVCFGINDLYKGCRTAPELIADLRTIARLLRAADCRVILFTIPPFNMTGKHLEMWYEVNEAIRTDLIREVTAVFDMAEVLGNPAPDQHDTKWGGHPNAEGCALVAREYLAGRHFLRRKPRILISDISESTLGNQYARALLALGCELVPDDGSADNVTADGLLLSGGGDVSPRQYGQEMNGTRASSVRPERDERELAHFRRYKEANKPIFGICRGIQLLNVALGGTLVQDLQQKAAHAGTKTHLLFHEVTAEPDSFVRALYGARYRVNSFHHQAIDRPGDGLRVVSTSDDGVVEAVQHESLPIWGVQYHPERMCHCFEARDVADGMDLFRFFVNEVEKRMY